MLASNGSTLNNPPLLLDDRYVYRTYLSLKHVHQYHLILLILLLSDGMI